MNNVEIERKFLMGVLPLEFEALPAVRIDQGYLNADKHRATRIRVTSDGEAFLTVKGLSHGATRVEIETPIDPDKARAMLAMVEGSIVSKLRRKVEFAGKTWEVDVFLADNAGLVVAEVELGSEDEPLDVPPWAGREVTTDGRYANSSLAMEPWTRWVKEPTPKASKL